MKLTLKFSFTDDQLQHLGMLMGAQLGEHATSNNISRFIGACIKGALACDSMKGNTDDLAAHIIEDIDRGGWSFIGQEAAKK